jgi:hypothetical protein
MADLGAPVAPLALAEGVPVYDRGRRRIGVVDRVVIDEATGIFDGVVVHTLPLPGTHLYADHEQLAELREGGVVLAVEPPELRHLEPRSARRRGSREDAERPLQRLLRKAWDWITGFR